jgi:hypothetical protein
MKTSVIAAALGLSFVVALAWTSARDTTVRSEAATGSSDCYADGGGPNEPTLCT